MDKIDNKKKSKLFLAGLIALLVMVIGATYAYFAVTTVSNFGTSIINATAGGIGTVTLDGNNAQLNLSVSALDMAQSNAKAYYASASGKTATPTEEVIGTASVTPNTDTNYYHCTYTLTVSQSYAGTKNLYNIFKGTEQVNSTTYTSSANELVLIVNGEEYDLHTNTLPKDIDGEFYVKVGSPATITAGLKFNNFNDKQQQLLGGSGVNISIVIKNGTFECNAEEKPASQTLIALSEELNDTTKIERYTGAVTDKCSANSCTTVQQAQNVYVVKSNTINNVLFEDFCWKIIRTTETRGVKLLYNGLPSTNGNHQECTANNNNVNLTATQMNTSSSTITYSQGGAKNSPAYVGYMYNKTTGTLREMLYGITQEEVTNETYGAGVYSTATNVNVNDSLLKEKTEYWFSNSNIDETKLEDAVYCNDRSLLSSSPATVEELDEIYNYSTIGQVYFKNDIYSVRESTLECVNQTDSFNTTNNKAKTNYKVGFLTESERYFMTNNDTTTQTVGGGDVWLGSPLIYNSSNEASMLISFSGGNNSRSTAALVGVRPVVSASSSVIITGGTGSTTNPFIFE